jgi:2-polyprenyl-6-methoxyphenol hydroxylase-like FAD-dependent oxidoreductase
MTPFMAQGAAQAIEDAVALAACLTTRGDVGSALAAYEGVRRPRTDRVQRESHANRWLKDRFDPSWLYGYDVVDDLRPVRDGS